MKKPRESSQGIAPRASRRTGRESLDSSGSSKHSDHTNSPVYKECLLFRSQPLQKLTRPDLLAFKALELSHRPSHKRLIDISQGAICD